MLFLRDGEGDSVCGLQPGGSGVRDFFQSVIAPEKPVHSKTAVGAGV